MMSSALPACISRGSGDAIVLLHGVGGGKAYWEPQLHTFAAAGLRAIAWDMPGYGESETVQPYAFATLAQALERLLDHLGLERVALLGHSMGGMVALEAWATFPARIGALLLAGTSPAFGKADGAWQQEFLRQRLAPLDAGRSMADIAPAIVRNLVTPDAQQSVVERAVRVISAVPAPTYRDALHALVTFDRRAVLPSISVPTLLLAGEADTTAPPAVMQKMAEKIPGASYRCLTRAGHLASLEHPQSFNSAVLAFMQPLRATQN